MKTYNDFLLEKAGGPSSPAGRARAQKQAAQNEQNRQKKQQSANKGPQSRDPWEGSYSTPKGGGQKQAPKQKAAPKQKKAAPKVDGALKYKNFAKRAVKNDKSTGTRKPLSLRDVKGLAKNPGRLKKYVAGRVKRDPMGTVVKPVTRAVKGVAKAALSQGAPNPHTTVQGQAPASGTVISKYQA